MVNIDEMQYAFVPGSNTPDAIFTVYQLQMKCIAVDKPFYFTFLDLEEASDRETKKFLV